MALLTFTQHFSLQIMNDKRSKWLIKGIDLIVEHGFEGFNIDELCRRMNIAKTSFYYHFISREIFLKELIRYWSDDMEPKVTDAIRKSAANHNLEDFLNHKLTNINFYCFLIQVSLYVKDKPELAQIVGDVENEIVEVTDSFLIAYIGDVKNEQVKTLVHTFLSGWDLLHGFKIYHKELDPKKARSELHDFFTNFSQNKSEGLLAS